MFIVPRIPITTAMIVSSNVTDSADYNAATTYGAGDLVTDPATFIEYESQQAGNIGHTPATDDGTWWVATGYTNSRRMFDGTLSAQTQNSNSVVVELDVGELFTSVTCFNVSGSSVTLKIEDGGSTIYEVTKSLVRTDDVQNIWDYLFTEPQFDTVAVFPSVPGHSSVRATLTISATGSTAKIGEVFFGRGIEIGETLVGSGPRIKDYSTKDVNEFGDFTVIERAYARGAEFEVAIDPERSDYLTRTLEENRAKICVFYPESDMEKYGLTIAGFYTDWSPGLTHRGRTIVRIPITGIS